MPFTLAHSVAARPLWRLSGERLVLSALALGAMAPDFEYLVHLSVKRTIGHSVMGVFVLCLPASLALLMLWHRLIGPAVARLVPDSVGGLASICARPFAFGPSRRFALIVLSTIVGSFSHLAWDAFTHSDGAVVVRVGFLMRNVGTTPVPVYKVLQYASGIIGMLLLVVWGSRAAARPADPSTPQPLPFRTLVLTWSIVAATAALVSAANGVRMMAEGVSYKSVLIGAVLGAMTGGGVALTVASLVVRARHAASDAPSGIP